MLQNFLNREWPYEPNQKRFCNMETGCMDMTLSAKKNELLRKTSFANDTQ